LAKLCAQTAIEKIAKDVLIIDLLEIETAPAEFFVLCSCDSDVQMRAIVDEVNEKCRIERIAKPRIEGITSKQWILLDFFDVVMHIMYYEARKYYNLEHLWKDGSFYKLAINGRLTLVKNKNKLLYDNYSV
jgi:ribosome-associated protein